MSTADGRGQAALNALSMAYDGLQNVPAEVLQRMGLAPQSTEPDLSGEQIYRQVKGLTVHDDSGNRVLSEAEQIVAKYGRRSR